MNGAMAKSSVFILAMVWLGGCAAPLQWSRDGAPQSTEQRRKLAMRYFAEAKIFELQNNYYVQFH